MFAHRRNAGTQLAKPLRPYAWRSDVILLALPRGGVPVAFEIACALHAPLDLLLVRKLGVPGQPELALGALAMPDICIFNHDILERAGLQPQAIERVIESEKKELARRNRAYRGGVLAPELNGRVVILVDDGMATGATMRAAVAAIRRQNPSLIIVAVPVASEQACHDLEEWVDEIICLQIPAPLYAVGQAYKNFDPITDAEVLSLLEEARHIPKTA